MEKYYGLLSLISAILTVLGASSGHPGAPLAGSIMTAGFAIASKMGSR